MFFIKQYKWSTRKDVKDLKVSIEMIRRTGREKILERLKEIQNKQYAENDILSSILMNASMVWLILFHFKCFIKRWLKV